MISLTTIINQRNLKKETILKYYRLCRLHITSLTQNRYTSVREVIFFVIKYQHSKIFSHSLYLPLVFAIPPLFMTVKTAFAPKFK